MFLSEGQMVKQRKSVFQVIMTFHTEFHAKRRNYIKVDLCNERVLPFLRSSLSLYMHSLQISGGGGGGGGRGNLYPQ